MATYKLIQDIEAEDKILGPLTLRQFIFALITAFLIYICFILVVKGVAFLLVIFVPPALFFGFFALPLGRDQPTEIWALAKIRYYFKPRRRIWNQSGVKELVTITAPKKVETVRTNGLSQTEVKSRLRALADTIDTRGWAVKNVNVNAFPMPPLIQPADTERLLDPNSLPQEVSDLGVTAADDILDEANNPIAQQFDTMIDRSAQAHRQEIMSKLQGPGQPPAQAPPAPGNDYWFMNGNASTGPANIPAPQAAIIDPAEEAKLVSELKAKTASHPAPYSNLRTIKPIKEAKPTPVAEAVPPVTAPAAPAILSLADNDDLNVATLAREAKRAKGEDDQNEVVVPLR